MRRMCKIVALTLFVLFGAVSIQSATACKLYNGKLSIHINPAGATGALTWVEGKVGRNMLSPSPVAVGSSSRWSFGEMKVVEGSLPPGLKIRQGGRFEGVPTVPGRYEVTVVFTNVRCEGMELGDHRLAVPFTIRD